MCSKKPRDLLEIAEWPTFPAKSMMRPPSIFLCLSGGGLRAALFHYGCLKRLQEVGLLGHVYTTSATSGGAITAALWSQDSDVDEEMGIWTYKCEEFEQLLLHTALRGLLGISLGGTSKVHRGKVGHSGSPRANMTGQKSFL